MTSSTSLLRPAAIGFGLLWLAFSLYAFLFAPSFDPETPELLLKLSTGDWSSLNPAVVALFNLMGIWPMIYACLALPDGRSQSIAAWPFVAGSFGVGAFAILPYLALRRPSAEPAVADESTLLKVLGSPWVGGAIAIAAAVLLGYGIVQGDWSDFIRQWQTSQFIHVMSLDFCLLCLIHIPLLKADMARRQINNPTLFWTAVLVPMLGVAVYLVVRGLDAFGLRRA